MPWHTCILFKRIKSKSVSLFFSSVSVGALVSSTRIPENVCGVQLYFSSYFQFVYVFLAFMVVALLSATRIQFQVMWALFYSEKPGTPVFSMDVSMYSFFRRRNSVILFATAE